jgi:hypothetical protein
MHPTLNRKPTDPQSVLIARVDEELAHTREQIARADEQLSKLERDTPRYPSDHPQTRRDTFRPAVRGNRPSLGGRARRGFIGMMLAACIGVAAIVLQSYGGAAKPIIARWVPQFVPTSSQPLENPGLSAQTASPQAAPLARTASQDVAPTAALVSPELAQLLQTMARDLANVEHGIEQLKANQEQMASDNAKVVEQLKASQEQVTRLVAKTSEQNLRPKASALPPRPIATAARKPVPTLPSQQAGERAQAPTQLQPEEQ